MNEDRPKNLSHWVSVSSINPNIRHASTRPIPLALRTLTLPHRLAMDVSGML